MIDSHYFINVVCGAPRLTGCAACSVNLPLNYDKLLLWSTFDNCKHVVQCSALAMGSIAVGDSEFFLCPYLMALLKKIMFIIYHRA